MPMFIVFSRVFSSQGKITKQKKEVCDNSSLTLPSLVFFVLGFVVSFFLGGGRFGFWKV